MRIIEKDLKKEIDNEIKRIELNINENRNRKEIEIKCKKLNLLLKEYLKNL